MQNYLKLALFTTCVTGNSLLSMNLEVKRKAAAEITTAAISETAASIAALSDFTECKTQAAATQEATSIDSLMPEDLSSDIWALVTDYSHDTCAEHEAYTQRKQFADASLLERLNSFQIMVQDKNNGQIIYDFQTRETKTQEKVKLADNEFNCQHKKNVYRVTLDRKPGEPWGGDNRSVAMYQPDGVTLINKFSITAPENIYYYNIFDNIIAFAITNKERSQFRLVLWNYETNTIKYACKLNAELKYIKILSRNRLALLEGDNLIIRDLGTKQDAVLVTENPTQHPTALAMELDNEAILTYQYDTVKIWDGTTYTCLKTILGCSHSILSLNKKVIIVCLDSTILLLDSLTLETSVIRTPIIMKKLKNYEGTIQPFLSKFDDNAIVIRYVLRHTEVEYTETLYAIYHPHDNNYYSHLEQYINLDPRQNNAEHMDFHDKHMFKIKRYTNPVDITWYDHDAGALLRKLTLEAKQNLKQLLTNLRERQTKLQAAGSQEAIKLEGQEIAWFTSLPERIQTNIKSHFNIITI